MKRAILVLTIAAILLSINPSASSNVIEANKNLFLKNSVPSSLASGRLKIELVPDSYPSEIYYKGAEICVTTIEQPTCYQRMDIEKFPQFLTHRITSDPKSKYSVVNLNNNTFVFDFTSVGKVLITIKKIYGKNQNSEFDNLISTIQIPLEITDVSTGGFFIEELKTAGVSISAIPILSCPEVKKNFNGYITCEATYTYYNRGIKLQVEPTETFKICAYKGDPFGIYGCKPNKNLYFAKEMRLSLNSIQEIKIQVYRDDVTSIHLQSSKSGEAVKQIQPNIMSKKQAATTNRNRLGRWIRKCKNVSVYSPNINDPMQIVDGRIQGGATTQYLKVCEDVWVP